MELSIILTKIYRMKAIFKSVVSLKFPQLVQRIAYTILFICFFILALYVLINSPA